MPEPTFSLWLLEVCCALCRLATRGVAFWEIMFNWPSCSTSAHVPTCRVVVWQCVTILNLLFSLSPSIIQEQGGAAFQNSHVIIDLTLRCECVCVCVDARAYMCVCVWSEEVARTTVPWKTLFHYIHRPGPTTHIYIYMYIHMLWSRKSVQKLPFLSRKSVQNFLYFLLFFKNLLLSAGRMR